MKFRGVMNKANTMKEFNNIVTTISKLSKECVLRFTDDKLYFIVVCDNSLSSPPVLWCEIFQNTFFSEYQMVGLDEENEEIYLRINSGNIARSLTPLKQAKSIKIKLTKRQCPCLTLEIDVPTSITQQIRQVTHDIPVTIVPRKMWQDYLKPVIPEPDISIQLPSLKHLRLAVERMRSMASQVVLRASANGQFNVQIKTDMAKVTAKFAGLTVESFSGPIEHTDSETESQIDNEDMSQVSYCRVDAKKLCMFLSADQLSHQTSICSIVHKKLVILCLQTVESVKLECFISGIVY